MTAEVLIVSPVMAPARGGLADHSLRLAQELAAKRRVAVLTSRGARGAEGFEVIPQIGDWHAGEALTEAIVSLAPNATILWQYVPHAYGRGGVNWAILRVMRTLQKRGRRQVILAHEIAAPFSAWPHRCLYALSHRYQWHALRGAAEALGISTEAWLEALCDREPGLAPKLFLAPSPATIPVTAPSADLAVRWRAGQGWAAPTRVLAYFGTLSRTKQFDWVVRAWQEAQAPGMPVGLAIIGDQPGFACPAHLQALFRPLGFLPAEEVSRALRAANVLALPYADGVSERRTTFMAGLAHDLAVVTTLGPSTGRTLRQAAFFRASTAGEPSQFARHVKELLRDPGQRQQIGERGGAAYREAYDWSRLVVTLTAQLPH